MDTTSVLAILTLISAVGMFLSTSPSRGGGHTKRHRSGGKKTRKQH